MLTCLPQSICSWNYLIIEPDVKASIEFDFWTEQGIIRVDSHLYKVQHAWLGGEWLLVSENVLVALAVKPNPFTRVFQVSYGSDDSLILRARSPLTRSFLIEQGSALLGTIEPMHPFTRRAFIDCSPSLAIPIQLFLFWLAVLMWRRAASNSGGGATGAGGAAAAANSSGGGGYCCYQSNILCSVRV